MKLAGHGSTAERLASVAELNLPRVESFTSVDRLQTDLTACFGDPVSRPVVAQPRIWRVVFEHRVDYQLAHDCLLFVVDTLDQIAAIRTGCATQFPIEVVPNHASFAAVNAR